MKNFFGMLTLSFVLFSSHGVIAQEAGAPEGPGAMSLIVQLAIIFAIFYFLLIRPQQKKMKDHQAMTQGLKRGDKILTGGGVAGTVTKAKEGERMIEVEIAEGVKVSVLRSTVSEMLEMRDKPEKDKKDQDNSDKNKNQQKKLEEDENNANKE